MTQLQRLVIASEQLIQSQIMLTNQQVHYLRRVLRLEGGDRFIALDGRGNWWLAVLSSEAAVADVLQVLDVQRELPVAITLLLALPKQGMDEVVRQTTELGVTCIQPIVSDRTLLKPSPQKLDRWQRIANEAVEQSERQLIPTLLPPISFADGLEFGRAQSTHCYICAARTDAPHLLHQVSTSPRQPMTLAIGPEGGWTDAELTQAIAAGYAPVSLGKRILRAVTAPVVALSLVAACMEAGGDEVTGPSHWVSS